MKGRNPPRMVPATPKGGRGGGAGGGRATRSAMKGARTSSRSAVAAEMAPVAVAQTPAGRGAGGGAARGHVTRSAIKGEVPSLGTCLVEVRYKYCCCRMHVTLHMIRYGHDNAYQ